MDDVALSAGERNELERVLHRTCDARVYRRVLAILEVSRGESVADVARMLGTSRQSVYNWLAEYDANQCPAALEDDPRSGRPSLWTEQRRAWLKNLMQVCPETCGYFANAWAVPLLQEELRHCTGREVSHDTIRRGLSQLGYVWKRSRYVLLPDPEREKKTPNHQENKPLAAAKRVAG